MITHAHTHEHVYTQTYTIIRFANKGSAIFAYTYNCYELYLLYLKSYKRLINHAKFLLSSEISVIFYSLKASSKSILWNHFANLFLKAAAACLASLNLEQDARLSPSRRVPWLFFSTSEVIWYLDAGVSRYWGSSSDPAGVLEYGKHLMKWEEPFINLILFLSEKFYGRMSNSIES